MRRTYNKKQRGERTGADAVLLSDENFRKAEFLIGIDPGVKTGFAVWSRTEKGLTISTTDFWGVISYLMEITDKSKFFVIIEDPNLNPAMHWNQHNAKGSINFGAKIAQNVGANKKEAELLIEWMKREGIHFYRYKPTTKKWTDEEFKRYTGYAGKCSQHARDAAAMVWGL